MGVFPQKVASVGPRGSFGHREERTGFDKVLLEELKMNLKFQVQGVQGGSSIEGC